MSSGSLAGLDSSSSGVKRREIVSRVGELPAARAEAVDREHDAIAVAGESALVDAPAGLRIGVEALGEKCVHEPRALAHAREDAVAEDRRGRGPGAAAKGAAEPAAEIPDGDLADPLRGLGRAAGKTRLPLNRGERNPMLEQKAVADRSRRRRGDAGLIRRRRGRIAKRAGENGVAAIGRLDYDRVRLGERFRRNDMKRDLIGNGRPSSGKLAQARDGLRGRDLAVDHALDIAPSHAAVGSGRQVAGHVDGDDRGRLGRSRARRPNHGRRRERAENKVHEPSSADSPLREIPRR